MVSDNILRIINSSSPLENEVTEKWKVGMAQLIFHVVSKKVLHYFEKIKNEHFEKEFFTLPPGTREKNELQFS